MSVSFHIGPNLFYFIEKHYKDYLEEFTDRDGHLLYNPELSRLTLKSNDQEVTDWFKGNILAEVSQRVFPLSQEDTLLMTEETTSKLFDANFQLGDLEYFIENHSLLLVGVKCRVQAGIDIFLKQFYYQFPLERAVRMYWTAFHSLKLLNLPDNLFSIQEKLLIIDSSLEFDDCTSIRTILQRINSDTKCVPFQNFVRRLIPAYIDYLKRETNSTVALCYENDDETFVRRYRPSSTPFLSGITVDIERCFHHLTHPITCTLKYDVNVFQIFKRRVPLKLLTKLEKDCLVCIHVNEDFSEIKGLSKEKVDSVKSELVKYIGNHPFTTEYSTCVQTDVQLTVPIPNHWTGGNQEECTLVQLRNNSSEFLDIAKHFHRTGLMPFNIHRIENRHQLYKYVQSKERLIALGIKPNEMSVFHGSSDHDPKLIYECIEGFDFRLAHVGMWGRGNYFSNDVRMADMFAYKKQENLKQFFVVRLLAGNVIQLEEDDTLVVPPFLPERRTGEIPRRYDTITGIHISGYQVYVVYTNERTLPEYLITYF